jgi:toxin ParE1/3/4
MTRLGVSITPSAKEDVIEIARYIAGENPTAADLFATEFEETVSRIRDFPGIGHRMRRIDPSLIVTPVSRRFPKFLVLYRYVDTNSLEVVRVLHGARDLPRLIP